MFDLSDKTALVTGAGSGIGEAIANKFAAARAIVFVADIDAAKGRGVVTGITGRGGRATFFEVDVRDPDACAAAAEQVHEAHGHLDILVNNAGVGHVGTMVSTEGEDLERMMAVNVFGVFHMTKVFMPKMIEHGAGNIINLASIGGVVGIRDRLAYCATKFAVVGMTKCIALDHSHEGIRVNAICPGRVETPFVKERLAEYPDPEAAHAEMSATQVVGRMGEPDEIASAALYLASDESKFVTGSTFMIDGGWSAGK